LQGRPAVVVPLLGNEARFPGPPCTISVPNLKTDRPHWLPVRLHPLNVRRLMYQTLIWIAGLRDETGGLRPPVDPEDLESAADSLIDGMRRNSEADRDLLRRQMLVDKQQAIELASAEPSDALGDFALQFMVVLRCGIRHPSSFR
jgi:hypothetical protein